MAANKLTLTQLNTTSLALAPAFRKEKDILAIAASVPLPASPAIKAKSGVLAADVLELGRPLIAGSSADILAIAASVPLPASPVIKAKSGALKVDTLALSPVQTSPLPAPQLPQPKVVFGPASPAGVAPLQTSFVLKSILLKPTAAKGTSAPSAATVLAPAITPAPSFGARVGAAFASVGSAFGSVWGAMVTAGKTVAGAMGRLCKQVFVAAPKAVITKITGNRSPQAATDKAKLLARLDALEAGLDA